MYELFLENMVLIYCTEITLRHRYVFDWIFEQWGIKYTATRNIRVFENSNLPKIWYARESAPVAGVIKVDPCGLLSEVGINRRVPRVVLKNDTPRLYFGVSEDADFDVFSAVFYLLSRYEEYLPFESDRHNRFPAASSLAYQNSFLEIPVVDIWVQELLQQLIAIYPGINTPSNESFSRMTYDIDVAYKYQGRSFFHQILAGGRDLLKLRWRAFLARALVLLKFKSDPRDMYEVLERQIRRSGLEAVFFFPCGSKGPFDRNPDPNHPTIRRLILKSKSFVKIGLHPSYQSVDNPKLLIREKQILEGIINEPVTESRQHFLRFKIPETLCALSEAGIKDDYSMGFPDAPGFRAGTCKPFYFFDLSSESITSLKMFPCCWMDATFVNYCKSDAVTALRKAKDLLQKVRKAGGWFIPIFHTDILEDKSWQETHDKIWKEVEKKNENAPQ